MQVYDMAVLLLTRCTPHQASLSDAALLAATAFCRLSPSLTGCLALQCRFVKMALQLLRKASLGGASRLAAYVRALPRGAALDMPLQWRPEELAALRYPYLQAEVGLLNVASSTPWNCAHDYL